jgi:DNA polymerase III delta prime subunit
LEDLSTNETLANNINDDSDYEHAPTSAQPVKARKKRARKNEDVNEKKNYASHTKNQASLERFTRPAQSQHVQQSMTESTAEITLEDDLGGDRKKRRQTASPAPGHASVTTIPDLNWHQQLQVEASGPVVSEGTSATTLETIQETSGSLLRAASPKITSIAPEHYANTEEAADAAVNKVEIVTPTKQIKVTKSGKLVSSPPKPHPEDSTTPKKRRGRKPAKAKVLPTVTIIKYGTDATSRHTIGGRIDAILAGIKSTTKRSTTTKKTASNAVEPPKSTHPFFLGKAAQTTEDAPVKPAKDLPPPTPRKSAVTPGKLRAEARREYSPQPMPAFGASSGANRVTKQAGLLEAAWPTRESSHVRNLQSESVHHMNLEVTRSLPLRARKLKNRVVSLGESEEVISRLARDIAADMKPERQESRLYFRPPEDVRLPKRLLTTGIEIQRRVHERLHTRTQWLDGQSSLSAQVHPAVDSLFKDIEHTLTPFDEGRCEGQAWAQKYSPQCASHVLSEGKDALVLRDWLQSLTVMAVGGTSGSVRIDGTDVRRPPKKKRKKAVDDFIVPDNDEEDEEMVEISGGDDNTMHAKSYRRLRWTRNNNVIVISGPHGCGKSATVCAVAKELDFEIFEINSGTRRSGKDIQDRVGDMTANHLVNHKRAEAVEQESVVMTNDTDNDTERMDTEFQKDIDSGRQGTMMTFFKSKPTTKPKPEPKPKTQETKSIPKHAQQTMQPTLNGPQKSQKQSLILFEEADILFEEDQQFWAQVTKLAAHSKRPIVVTCNDESQIPLDDLPLAAVLRLHPSPVELATDYMLVLAGREGHILERGAVRYMYESKNRDLRASITELNLWCQMSVGDKKGGLEWMYQRWPPGNDIDANGRLLRVASEGTYQSGMGWLSHNVFETTGNSVFDQKEELLNEVWADWGIDPNTWETSSSRPADLTQTGSLKDLEQLDNFMETLSAVDVFCRVGLPSYDCDFDEPADPTLPPMFDKLRLSYTLAAPLIQADTQTDFLQFDTSICTQAHLLARRAHPELASLASSSTGHNALSEMDYTTKILRFRDAKSKEHSLNRLDFSHAMDCLAAPPDQTLPERTSFILTPSSFDRTFGIITLDLAPYVRSIVAHEQILETQRVRLSNLLSAGGNGKRARTTRASRVALEGGVRETKRRDRWFEADVNFELVMATAGKEWAGMGWRNEDEEIGEGSASVTGTQDSLAGSQDVLMHDGPEETVPAGIE